MRGRSITATTAITAVAAFVVSGCSSSPLTNASSTEGEPSRSAEAPGLSATTAPRPTETLPPAELALSWSGLYGASVPVADRVGPRRQSRAGFAGWQRSPSGSALAASYFAVVVDSRMPPQLWRSALEDARPTAAAARLRRRFAAALPRAQANGQEPSNGHALDSGPPGHVWRPPVSVVATSAVDFDRESARMTVWSRTDDGQTWRSRLVRVAWRDGDWRLRLPVGEWRVSRPPQGLRPLTAGVQEQGRGGRR
jgi:hypothetical protein